MSENETENETVTDWQGEEIPAWLYFAGPMVHTVANASHAETFHFVDDAGHKHELVTRFAFYLIDYLEGRLA